MDSAVWDGVCMCCSNDAAQSRCKPFQRSRTTSVCFNCINCNFKQAFSCAKKLVASITAARVPERVIMTSPYLTAIMPYCQVGAARPTDHVQVPMCMHCELSSSIPSHVKADLPIKKLPCPRFVNNEQNISLACADESDDESDDELTHRKRTKYQKAVLHMKELLRNFSFSGDSMSYLRGYKDVILRVPDYGRYLKNRHVVQNSEFDGALYFPSHNLIICSYAHNSMMKTDHHGLAASSIDQTPGIPHMVLDPRDVTAIEAYRKNGGSINYLKSNHFKSLILDHIPLPDETTRSWKVDYACLPQVCSLNTLKHLNGRTRVVPTSQLFSAKVLSWKNSRTKADHVIITGDLDIERMLSNSDVISHNNDISDDEEAEETKVVPGRVGSGCKLLLSRMQSMLSSSVDDITAEEIFANVLPFCGKNGWEVNRKGGTNGYVTDQSKRNLLSTLAYNKKLLPNKAGASLILIDRSCFWIFYHRHNSKAGSMDFAYIKYAPPKVGGSVILRGNIIDKYSIIGEFCYTKMITVLLINELNSTYLHWVEGRKCSAGAIACELESIEYARTAFKINQSYAEMCKAYLSCNSMSIVAWPVAQHVDYFNKKGESIENKLLLVMDSIKGDVGRGGALVKDKFVYALLDWSHVSRSARRFLDTHSQEMGLGVPAPSNAQRVLTDYFQTNPNGAYYQNLFNGYVNPS